MRKAGIISLWILIGVFTGLQRASADSAKASGTIRQGDDVTVVAINVSSEPQVIPSLRVYVLEAYVQYTAIWERNISIAPGEVKAFHNRRQEPDQTANHFHTTIEGDIDHHKVVIMQVITDKNGHLTQLMGPTEHSQEPTLVAPPRQPDPKYPEVYASLGYELIKAGIVGVVVNNGPQPNRIDVKLQAFETGFDAERGINSVCGSGPPNPFCDVAYHDFGLVAPGATVVTELKNDPVNGVKYAHHGNPSISMDLPDGADHSWIFKSSEGYIYGYLAKNHFTAWGGGELAPKEIPYPVSTMIVEPQHESVVSTTTPTFRWRSVDASALPANSSLLHYLVEVSSTADFSEILISTHVRPSPSEFTTYQVSPNDFFPWLPNSLVRGSTYHMRLAIVGSYPGIPSIPPEEGTWMSRYLPAEPDRNHASFTIER